MRIGLEKSHASTVDPGSKPESLIRILSPVFNRTLPSASRAVIVPVSSIAARLACIGPADTTSSLSTRVTVAGLVESPTFTPASPAPTDGIFGAGGSVVPTGAFGTVVLTIDLATALGVVAVVFEAGVVVVGVVAGVTTLSFALVIVVVVALNTISSTGGAVVVVTAGRALLVNVADALLYPDRVARTTMLEDSPADRPVTETSPDD
jgi:hypothetical protein